MADKIRVTSFIGRRELRTVGVAGVYRPAPEAARRGTVGEQSHEKLKRERTGSQFGVHEGSLGAGLNLVPWASLDARSRSAWQWARMGGVSNGSKFVRTSRCLGIGHDTRLLVGFAAVKLPSHVGCHAHSVRHRTWRPARRRLSTDGIGTQSKRRRDEKPARKKGRRLRASPAT